MRRALLASGQANVLQIGKYNINIGQGQNIQIGDRIYQGPDLETLRRLIQEVQAESTADRYAAYFLALRTYCANLPYLTLHDIRPPKNLDEVYLRLRAKPHPARDEIQGVVHELLSEDNPLSIAEVLQNTEKPHLLRNYI